jgi:hypothetical protein
MNIINYKKTDEEDILESLSTWKKWNILLDELIQINWDKIVSLLRNEWKKPRFIAKILKFYKKNK